MSTLIKKRVQYSVDEAISESAEYIIKKVGLTPASVFSMVMAEIAKTGRIPVSNQISDDDFNTAQLIALSHNIPSVKVSNTKSIQAFLEDDGGY
uniref:type II toxin-antitoxin system RelB/DinJ family antitoxin n=1 Tax=uncultured Acinetobacter sp. TaxID=165433 RepID=UPI002622C2D6|nr:type II toxin-antitoxin system RelB/DinJ family antitoxin [uncultured Acinetobacter sp.]